MSNNSIEKLSIKKLSIKNLGGNLYKYNNGTVDFTRLNEYINWMDVLKDANQNIAIKDVNDDLFTNAKNLQYKNIKSYVAKTLENEFLVRPRSINTLKKPYNMNFKSEMDIVEYGYHDSGYTPKTLKKDMKVVITPGSYFDPGSRTIHDGDEYYPLGIHSIEQDEFEHIGFHKTTVSTNLNMNKICTIEITFHYNNKSITIKDTCDINKKKTTHYFNGNIEKNNLFDSDSINGDEKAKVIMAKEMGDTLQVIYAYKHMLHNGFEKKTEKCCVFTLDEIVKARCLLFGISCAYQDKEKKEKDIIHLQWYMVTKDPELERKLIIKNYIDCAIQNNINNRNLLNKCIMDGKIYIGNDELKKISDGTIRQNLVMIIDVINDVNANLETLKLDESFLNMDIIVIKKICSSMSCNTLFYLKGINKSLSKTKRLFPVDINDTINDYKDPIGDNNNKLNLQELIINWSNTIRIPRGGDSADKGANKLDTELLGEMYIPEESEDPDDATKKLLNAIIDELSEVRDREETAVEIIYMLYNFFYIIGEVCYHSEFIKEIVKIYNQGNLQLLSISELLKIYNNWCSRNGIRNIELNYPSKIPISFSRYPSIVNVPSSSSASRKYFRSSQNKKSMNGVYTMKPQPHTNGVNVIHRIRKSKKKPRKRSRDEDESRTVRSDGSHRKTKKKSRKRSRDEDESHTVVSDGSFRNTKKQSKYNWNTVDLNKKIHWNIIEP
jgi:hypothetical protein